MPQLAVFKGEKSIGDLAARLFGTTGSAATRQQATDALLRANPQLANLDRVPAGSLIVVPDTQQNVNTAETVSATALASGNPMRPVSDQLNALTGGIAGAARAAAAQGNASLALLADSGLKAAAANDPDLAQRLAALDTSTRAALKDQQDKQALLQQGLAQMQQDLARFLNPASAPAAPPTPGPSSTPPPPLVTPQPPAASPPAAGPAPPASASPAIAAQQPQPAVMPPQTAKSAPPAPAVPALQAAPAAKPATRAKKTGTKKADAKQAETKKQDAKKSD